MSALPLPGQVTPNSAAASRGSDRFDSLTAHVGGLSALPLSGQVTPSSAVASRGSDRFDSLTAHVGGSSASLMVPGTPPSRGMPPGICGFDVPQSSMSSVSMQPVWGSQQPQAMPCVSQSPHHGSQVSMFPPTFASESSMLPNYGGSELPQHRGQTSTQAVAGSFNPGGWPGSPLTQSASYNMMTPLSQAGSFVGPVSSYTSDPRCDRIQTMGSMMNNLGGPSESSVNSQQIQTMGSMMNNLGGPSENMQLLEHQAVRMVSPVVETRWFARVCNGDMRSLALPEVHELFRVVCGSEGQELDLVILREQVARSQPPRVLLRQVDDLLAAAEAEEGGTLDAESFLQAMRLGSAGHAVMLSDRMKGVDPAGAGRIERGRLIGYLRKQKEVRDSFFSLPLTCLLFVLFFALAVIHLEQRSIFKLTEAVESSLPIAAFEQSYPSALWDWLDQQGGQSRVARFNELVGGVHLESISDSGKPGFELRTLCSYRWYNYLLKPSRQKPEICLPADQRPGNSTQQWVMWPVNGTDAAAAVDSVRSWWELPSSAAANHSTAAVPLSSPDRVQVSLLARNGRLDFNVLYRLVFHIPATGGLRVTRIAAAFSTDPLWKEAKCTDSIRCFVMTLDVLFMILLVVLAGTSIYNLVTSVKRLGFRRGVITFCNVWECIDWISIVMGALLIVLYMYSVELSNGLQQLLDKLPPVSETERYSQEDFVEFIESPGSRSMSWNEYQLHLEAALEQATLVALAQEDSRWYASVLATSLGLRFFKAFRANPRLNIVNLIVQKALRDFAHFFMMFCFIFLGFAVIGHATFGAYLEEFSTIGEAVHTTFLMMMGFLFDTHQDTMFKSGGGLAVLWATLFHLFVVLLLLDMVLVIVLDVYAQVKPSAGRTPSLWRQGRELLCPGARTKQTNPPIAASDQGQGVDLREEAETKKRRCCMCCKRSKGERVWSESRLLDALEKQGGEHGPGGAKQVITLDFLSKELKLDVADSSGKIQLEALLHYAAEQVQAEREAISLSDSVRLCNRADNNLRELGPMARELKEHMRRWEGERKELLAKVERSVHQGGTSGSTGAAGGKKQEEEVCDVFPPTAPRTSGSSTTGVITGIRPASNSASGDGNTGRSTPPQDPDPEPPVAGSGLQLDQFLEQQLTRAAEAQAERHGRLEESIMMLERTLQPLLERGEVGDNGVDATRLKTLEEKVNQLATTLAPVLDFRAPPPPGGPQMPLPPQPPAVPPDDR